MSRGKDRRLMVIGQERVFYLGLLGMPSQRTLGAHVLYSGLNRPFELCVGDVWTTRWLSLVPAWQPHRISTEDGLISAIMLEPEAVDDHSLLECVAGISDAGARFWASRIRRGYARLHARGDSSLPDARAMDQLFLGVPLSRAPLDPRVARIVQTMQLDPCRCHAAEACAADAGLSFSRFLHLFKQETGVSFRKFRAWKRARNVLYHVNRRHSMTDVALEMGYPDSAHFSRCVRQVYGLCPSEIFSGSRSMTILVQAGGAGNGVAPRSVPLSMASNAG